MNDNGQVFANWEDPATNMPENVANRHVPRTRKDVDALYKAFWTWMQENYRGPRSVTVGQAAREFQGLSYTTIGQWMRAYHQAWEADPEHSTSLRKWNVKLPVVAVVQGASAEAAIARLRAQLSAHGFDVYEGEPGHVFESEDTE